MNAKRDHEKVIRTAVCFPVPLWEFAEDYQKDKAYPTFSAMLQALLREKREESQKQQTASR